MRPVVTGLPSGERCVTACVKWVDLRPEVDSLTGAVTHDLRTFGISPSDESAVALARAIADAWGLATQVICVGPAGADDVLRDLLARRVDRVLRVDGPVGATSAAVAAEIARLVGGGVDGDVGGGVECGDSHVC